MNLSLIFPLILLGVTGCVAVSAPPRQAVNTVVVPAPAPTAAVVAPAPVYAPVVVGP
jgi:hypothetical protein